VRGREGGRGEKELQSAAAALTFGSKAAPAWALPSKLACLPVWLCVCRLCELWVCAFARAKEDQGASSSLGNDTRRTCAGAQTGSARPRWSWALFDKPGCGPEGGGRVEGKRVAFGFGIDACLAARLLRTFRPFTGVASCKRDGRSLLPPWSHLSSHP